MKDLCLVKNLPEMIELGISSLKIEGRLRSVKYVQAATKLYRKAIDSYYAGKFEVDKELYKEMKLAFNREFTWGYYSKSQNVVSDERPMGRGLYLGEINKQGLIKLEEDVSLGDGIGIWLPNKVDGAVLKKIDLDGITVEDAKKGDLVKLHIRAKPGTKIYITSVVKESKEIIFEQNKPIMVKERSCKEIILPEIKNGEVKEELLVKVYSFEDAKIALRYTDKVFYDIFAKDFDNKFSAYIPRLLNDQDVEKSLELIRKYNIKDILIGNLGVYTQLKGKGFNLYLDYSNNIFNDLDLNYFDESTALISPEISFNELKEFNDKNFAAFVHGKIVMMNTKYEQLPPKLKDQKKYVFPVRQEHNYYQILNSKELGFFEKINDLKGIGVKKFFLDLDYNVEKFLDIYTKILSGKKVEVNKFNFTKGHWDRGVE